MVRRIRIRSVVFGVAVLIVSHAFLELHNPAFGQEVSTDNKAALKERDRLWDQTQKLRTAGRLTEAIAAGEAMLAIERRVLAAAHPDLVSSLNWLADLHLWREDFAAAKTARSEALELLSKRYGESHWMVTDARLALEDIERRANMTDENKLKLTEANRLVGEVNALLRAGKNREAIATARRVSELKKEALGERHKDYAASINNLAVLLDNLGDFDAAKSLYQQATALNRDVLGERHPEYARNLHNMANSLTSLGDYAAARPLLEEALKIRKTALGER
jgi:tetratricopeptide (TPR) repeat protein